MVLGEQVVPQVIGFWVFLEMADHVRGEQDGVIFGYREVFPSARTVYRLVEGFIACF